MAHIGKGSELYTIKLKGKYAKDYANRGCTTGEMQRLATSILSAPPYVAGPFLADCRAGMVPFPCCCFHELGRRCSL